MIPNNDWSSFIIRVESISKHAQFLRVWLYSPSLYYLTKELYQWALKHHLFLLNFMFLDGTSALLTLMSCCDHSYQHHTVQSIFHNAKKLGRSSKTSSIFHWNISSASASPNVSLLNLYLPIWHTKLARYDDRLPSLRLWKHPMASISVRYCTFDSFGNISLTIGPLGIGVISAWLILVGSKHG